MLTRLTVANLATVESAEAVFGEGLNVLTGETGAGKSVLMGALALALGGRCDSTTVRDGAKEARVEAEFDCRRAPNGLAARVDALLAEAGVEPCEEGRLVVRRTVGAGGGSRVWVNDAATTVATLRRLGGILADVHGPRANQNLLDETYQRSALDAFGDVELDACAQCWAVLQDARRREAELAAAGVTEEELEMLRYAVDELEKADLSDDDEDLAERHAAAAHAQELAEEAAAVTEALGGDGGAAELLARLGPRFAAMARHLPAAADWAREAEELTVRIQELSRTVADATGALDADPGALEELDARLTLVSRLKRRYLRAAAEDGVSDVGRLRAELETRRRRLDELEHRAERLEELKNEIAAAEAALRTVGAEVTVARKRAATRLGKAVTDELHDLGFLRARFAVEVTPAEPTASGCDRVTYFFAPNPGEAPRALAEIASSGETARVMLAMKGVLSAHEGKSLVVFDEIDANIGGETGRAVGAKMRALARHLQVIAITHLPQSAVFADRHLVVSKAVSGGRTRTGVAPAEGEARISEIARMLGGENLTSVVRRHASELLEMARGISKRKAHKEGKEHGKEKE